MEIKKKKRELLPYHGLSSKIVQFVVESVARLWLQRLQIPNQVRVFLCPCVGPVSWHIVIMALYFMINLELTILSLHEYSFKIWILRYSSLFDLIPWCPLVLSLVPSRMYSDPFWSAPYLKDVCCNQGARQNNLKPDTSGFNYPPKAKVDFCSAGQRKDCAP